MPVFMDNITDCSIQFDPILSQNKSQAIRNVHYLSSSKVILVFHSVWWKKSGAELGGTVISGREKVR